MIHYAADSFSRHTERSLAALRDQGVRCVLRYHYNTDRREVDLVHAAGLAFCLIAEFDTNRPVWHPPADTPEIGDEHARTAVAAAGRLGAPEGCKVILAADTLIRRSDFARPERYWGLAAPIIRDAGYLVGAYGGSLLIDHLHDAGLADDTWEAAAASWSSENGTATSRNHPHYVPSRTAVLRQLVDQPTIGGVQVDLNVFVGESVGEWMPDGTAGGHTIQLPALKEGDMYHVITQNRPDHAYHDTTWVLCGLEAFWAPSTDIADVLIDKAETEPQFFDYRVVSAGDPWMVLLDSATVKGPVPT